MGIIDSLKWRYSLSRNATFWGWMVDTYSADELRRLKSEATDCDLLSPYSLTSDRTIDQQRHDEAVRMKTAHRLYRRYGNEIWRICLRAGGYNADNGLTGIKCLIGLDLAFQVCDFTNFEEFMVRNALKHAAREFFHKAEQSEVENAGSHRRIPADEARKVTEGSSTAGSTDKPPSSEDFWRARRAEGLTQSDLREVMNSLPPIVLVSFPTRPRSQSPAPPPETPGSKP